MIFESKDLYIDFVNKEDINNIIDIYNSNKDFLMAHMDKEEITKEWIIQEIESMNKIGFKSCKIVEKNSEKMIGVIDFMVGEEAYLSLLMIHNDFKGKGYGMQSFQAFEDYLISMGSKRIRIDVVTEYDSSVLDFWINKGFVKFKDIELNWTGKKLPAVTMTKEL